MVGDVQALFTIDYKNLIIGILLIITAVLAVWKIWDEINKRTGIETKWGRQKREQRELLNQTAKNLVALQKKTETDENEIKDALNSFIEETRLENEKLRIEMRTFSENRCKDREVSRGYRDDFTNAIKDISGNIDKLRKETSGNIDKLRQETNERFNANEEKENQRVQSDIKDRIARYYRQYHVDKRISEMEFEGLEDLIKTYERYGGENSFVHSTVQQEMYTWERYDNIIK